MDPLATAHLELMRTRLQLIGLSCTNSCHFSAHRADLGAGDTLQAFSPPPTVVVEGNPLEPPIFPPRAPPNGTSPQASTPVSFNPPNPEPPVNEWSQLAHTRLGLIGLSFDPQQQILPPPPSAVVGKSRLPRASTQDIEISRDEPEVGTPPSTSQGTRRQSAEQHTPELEPNCCVICLDEDAIMAAIDCGHLAMCRECSDGVMRSSRSCPLCRKHIAEGRLIRIFKT
ncbi:hypothetical protein C8R45DRAFT_387683 [Mycena sanguinolenta]|nr:hypothetical protein C8R45DRAFT_387683 [Mycena sanguinolenta]